MYLRIGDGAAAFFAAMLVGRGCSEPGVPPEGDGGAYSGLGADAGKVDGAGTDSSGTDGAASTGPVTDSGIIDSGQGADEALGADAIPDVNAGSEAAEGNDGGATDPLSFSGTSLVFTAACGSTPQSESPTITNVSSSPATWMQYNPAAEQYTLSLSGSTLAPGASVTVTVSAPPVPAVPSALAMHNTSLEIYSTTGGGALEIAEGGDTVTTTNGELFTNTISVMEDVEGCIAQSLPSNSTLAFGDVPVGSTASQTFCMGRNGITCNGTAIPGEWEIGGGCSVIVSPSTMTPACGDAGIIFSVGPLMNGLQDCWPISFTPETVGTQTATLGLTYLAGQANCWATVSLTLTGTGVADAGP